MKRVLVVAALLTTLAACGGTDPGSKPIPTVETPDPTTSTSLPTAPTSTTTTTTAPPPAAPATDVPDVAPDPVDPPAYMPPPYTPPPAPYTPPPAAYTPPPAAPYIPPPAEPAGAYYANCSEARAAGAAPLYRGDPGYRPALDRDGDGVACES